MQSCHSSFRAQNETEGNSHFSEIATSKDVSWLLPSTPLYMATRLSSGSCRSAESLSGYRSKTIARASNSLISAFRRFLYPSAACYKASGIRHLKSEERCNLTVCEVA